MIQALINTLLDDQAHFGPSDATQLVMLFAQSLDLRHGDGKNCKLGLYINNKKPSSTQEPLYPQHLPEVYYSESLERCVEGIVKRKVDYEQIDGKHVFLTDTSEDPKAADLITALQAGYKWIKEGDKFKLANVQRIPAWFDYTPEIVTPPEPAEPKSSNSSNPLFWVEKDKPQWHYQQYTLPKGYQWKSYEIRGKGSRNVYALVPDGYDLKPDGQGRYVLAKHQEPVVSDATGNQFSYADAVVNYVWPDSPNYFYVELRKGPHTRKVNGAIAESTCFPEPNKEFPDNNVVCGFFKIGNLLQIMQRLADMACTGGDPESVHEKCPQSIFGIGKNIPSWADFSAPYQGVAGINRKYVWVPAHDPKRDASLAHRDRYAFFTLYKLYQLSLVDTSKLVTGATPISISK